MGSNRYHMSGSNIELYKILNGFAWVESKQSGLNLGAEIYIFPSYRISHKNSVNHTYLKEKKFNNESEKLIYVATDPIVRGR